ncbi:hypothetical protein pipiens_014938 [Culex pipiens pipiens]|uniref:Uncharacterized protein n=1 Tax=Culex pipiens pipiens TaxID=38569 RepID=A0ABD1CSI5_CULPP
MVESLPPLVLARESAKLVGDWGKAGRRLIPSPQHHQPRSDRGLLIFAPWSSTNWPVGLWIIDNNDIVHLSVMRSVRPGNPDQLTWSRVVGHRPKNP